MASFRGFFHWRVSGVFIFFFCALAFTMLSLSPSVDNPQPLLIMAYIFLVAGLFWSLGYWLTCDFLRKKNTKFWKRRKREKATAWQKKAYYVWKYSVASLIICIFIASAFLSQWTGKQIEIKNTKTGQILTAILEAVNIIKKTSQQPIIVTPENEKRKIEKRAPVEIAYLQGTVDQDVIQIGLHVQIAFIWTNQGQFPAKNAIPFAQLHIRSDRLVSTQESIIKQFKEDLKEKLKELMKKERKWIFPGKQSEITASGPMLTKSLWEDLINGRKILFGISAVVFDDEAGRHEAHFCTFADNIVGAEIIKQNFTQYNYKITWKDCEEYNTQIDIK